jgi:hypothetical protein
MSVFSGLFARLRAFPYLSRTRLVLIRNKKNNIIEIIISYFLPSYIIFNCFKKNFASIHQINPYQIIMADKRKRRGIRRRNEQRGDYYFDF